MSTLDGSSRRLVTAALVGGLFVAGCGSTPDSATLPTSETVTEAVDTLPGVLPDGVAATASEMVSAAFEQLGEARGYRSTTASAQTQYVAAVGIDVRQELDPDRPISVVEVAPNGDYHATLDLGSTMRAMAAGDPELAARMDTVDLQLWKTSDELVIDATGYAPIADLNPSYDLGPYAPGIGRIDLARIADVSSDELVAALTGGTGPDPIQLAATLPASLTGIEQDPDDPTMFHAFADFATVTEATGGDIVTLSRGLAIALAPALGLDVDVVAEFYQRLYTSSPTEIELVVFDGIVQTLHLRTDLSQVYEDMFDLESGLGMQMSEAERAEAAELFSGAILVIESLTRFELDDSIRIEPPIGDLEDRTDAAARFFAALNP